MSDDGATHWFGDGHDHGPCPTCGTEFSEKEQDMSGWLTEEMVNAAASALHVEFCGGSVGDAPNDDDFDYARVALTAALDVAPKADGWVWCEREGSAAQSMWIQHGYCMASGLANCPAPHRTLLIGPEVTS